MSLSPGTRLGPYEIQSQLGAGGMGEVYRATDTRLGRTVAIKVLPERLTGDSEHRERLEREARAASSLNHPNICTLYDIGTSTPVRAEPVDPSPGEPVLFLVMEYLEGETLETRLAREPLPLSETVEHGLVLLSTLDAVHRQGLVHRDLKPSNVFLTPHGLKVLDFGLARPVVPETDATRLELTPPGTIVGTPRYMAPEALKGRAVDGRADLFAVGALLYEMVSGKPAFSGDSAFEIGHAVMHEQPPMLTGSAAIAALDRVIHRALVKRQDERYQDAPAMARDLGAVLVASGAGAVVAVQQVPRLIVLPFRMLRPEPDAEFLAFSLPDAIATSLSGLPSLVVRSTLAGGRFAADRSQPELKALAGQAEVDLVLLGSLLRGGDQLQVNAQLVEAPSGTIIWSERSQVAWDNIFQVQEELTKRIVDSLAVPLSAAEQQQVGRDVPASARAYEHYLRANQLVNQPSEWKVARDLYRQVVEEDANSAPAWARLGRVERVIAKYLSQNASEIDAGYSAAERAFQRALALNPDLTLAHNYYTHQELDQGRARESIVRLLERVRRSRGDAELFAGLVQVCRYCGLIDASLAAHDRAKRLDPQISTSAVWTMMQIARHEEAIVLADGADPSDVNVKGARIECLVRLGRQSDARRFLDGIDSRQLIGYAGCLFAFMRTVVDHQADPGASSDLAERTALIKDPEMHYLAAGYYSYLGDGTRALQFLRLAVDGGFCSIPAMAANRWFDPLRADPEFGRLLQLADEKHRAAVAAFTEAKGERLLGL